jgi:hypothetical protein
MGTNYIVPNASPFKENGVSSITPGLNIEVSPGTGAVVVTDLGSAVDYVSSLNGATGAVSFTSTVGTIVSTLGGNQIVFTQKVADIQAGSKVIVTPSAGAYTINFI